MWRYSKKVFCRNASSCLMTHSLLIILQLIIMHVNGCQLETTVVNSALCSEFVSFISSVPVMQKEVMCSHCDITTRDLSVSCHQG